MSGRSVSGGSEGRPLGVSAPTEEKALLGSGEVVGEVVDVLL